uniref:TACC_C domain-containing protein n=1 Tax=Globodera pallida TaxID=36090 RepID=A0A183BJ80_GLOPA
MAKIREKRWTEVVEKCEKDKAMESQLYELKLKAAKKNSEKATELFKILEENGIDIDAVLTDRFADSIRRHFQSCASTPRANESPNSAAANCNETVFKLMREKDALSGEINSLEENYSNLFKLYEKMRLNCVNLKEVEQSLRVELDGLGQKYGALHKMYTELLVEAQKKLEDANEELRHSDKEHVQKTMALRLALKRAQIRLGSVEKALELKNKENAELHDIYGQLIEAREQFEQQQQQQQHNNSSKLSVADNESAKENSTAHGRHLFSQC